MAFDAQCSPGPAMSLGLKAVIRRGSHYACLWRCCAAWAPRLAVGPSSSSTRLGGGVILGRDLARWGICLPF